MKPYKFVTLRQGSSVPKALFLGNLISEYRTPVGFEDITWSRYEDSKKTDEESDEGITLNWVAISARSLLVGKASLFTLDFIP
jgi:hypoxanthine-guanine phosphoribosyltransferase